MNNKTKNALYSLLLLIAVIAVYFIRKDNNEPILVTIQGRTMGPIVYNIKYFDQHKRNLKLQIDSILEDFNQSLSTYIPESEISQFNRDSIFRFESPYFYESLVETKQLSEATEGAFNPTIMPLVNFWGFGPEKKIKQDTSMIDSLKALVDYDLVQFDENKVWKLNKAVSLDFSASAKGQGVDVVSKYLKSRGIQNYFVEIGGEVRTGGINLLKERGWVVGIINPKSTEDNISYYATVELNDKAMATSGNYFNYRIIDGQRYSHTISPFTGYPIILPILSATVVAEDCLTADALATAFMVMGHEEAKDFLNNHPEYEALLIYSSDEGEIKHYETDELNINFR